LLPLVLWLVDRPLVAGWAPAGAALAIGLLLALSAAFDPAAPGMQFLGGFLLGSPLLLLAALLTYGERPPAEVLLVAGGSIDLLSLSAASSGLPGGAGPGALALAAGQLVGRQDGAWTTLLGGANPASVPLQFPADGVLAGLLVLALAGAFLAFFTPSRSDSPGGDPSELLRLGPVFVGVASAALFEVAAARAPSQALLLLGIAAVVTVAAILLVQRPRRAPAAPPPAAPAPPKPATRPRDRGPPRAGG
ncbi:MAG: hypothetical protein ACREC5_03455, partial [Thermoplasmata archaeon]